MGYVERGDQEVVILLRRCPRPTEDIVSDCHDLFDGFVYLFQLLERAGMSFVHALAIQSVQII